MDFFAITVLKEIEQHPAFVVLVGAQGKVIKDHNVELFLPVEPRAVFPCGSLGVRFDRLGPNACTHFDLTPAPVWPLTPAPIWMLTPAAIWTLTPAPIWIGEGRKRSV